MSNTEVQEALRAARTKIDRMTIERANLLEKIGRLEEETEAQRELMAAIAKSVGGAVL